MAGYGGGSWGYMPWGGAEYGSTVFDLFCFDDCEALADILSSPLVTTFGDGEQFVPDYPDGGDACDLGIISGSLSDGAFPSKAAVLQIEPTLGVPTKWTFEWTMKFGRIPQNFNDLVNNHLYVGTSNNSGPVGGIFISTAGLAYAGDIRHTGPNNTLVLNGPFEPIPGTAGLVPLDRYVTFRLSSDKDTGMAYLYVTTTSEIDTTGHRLVAVLPALGVVGLALPASDRSVISVKGTSARPTIIALARCCLSASSLVPNLPPIADAGPDQVLRLCSILRLDGSRSFDPEGVPLHYLWQLVDAPLDSSFTLNAYDGVTHPLVSPTGFTTKLHSVELGLQHVVDNITVGDILVANGQTRAIVSIGTDVNGFYVALSAQFLADSLSGLAFRVVRQRGISNSDQVRATFMPDVLGFFRFSLVVHDGVLFSQPSVAVTNVVESVLPRGITPDLSFIFGYLSDFWNLVEGKERLEVFWSSLAQVAATELWALWQLEYSRSLRDIQRTFTRRWLHYDLLLGEPLPELTTVRAFYSGVLSISITPGSSVGPFDGTGFTLTSPAFAEEQIVEFDSLDTSTVFQAQQELLNRLLEVDFRFTVQIIEKRDSNFLLRINAPFPFSIVDSTYPLFTAPKVSGSVSGSAGARIGPRSYRTGVCLLGLGLQENDILILNGEAYLIAAVTDDPGDNIPFQRLSMKSDLPLLASADWIISGYVTSELLNFYEGLVSNGDDVFFEVNDARTDVAMTSLTNLLVQTTARGVAEGRPGALAIDVTPLLDYLNRDDRTVRLAKIVRRTYIPVHKRVVDVPTLVRDIQMVDDSATLHFNLDFLRETYRGFPCLQFISGLNGDPDVWEGETPPDRLWAEYTYLDNKELIEERFGIPAEFTLDDLAQLPDTVDYLSAVQGLWYAYYSGPTMYSLRVGSQILLGLPFAEVQGTIEEIRTDFSPSNGRMLVRDKDRPEIVRSYSFVNGLALETNPATSLQYAVGDTVEAFAPLVRGVEVVDYVKSPKWIEGFVRQGIYYEIEKFHRFLVRVDSKAFNLEALLFAKAFVLKIKPRYTFPLFLVRFQAATAEVDITDENRYNVRLSLDDAVCMPFSSHIYDDARGGGGYWNQFDSNQGNPVPPTFPTPDPVDWAYDKWLLCPGDDLVLSVCTNFAGGAVTYDSVFSASTNVTQRLETSDTTDPYVVPTGATGLVLTPDGTAASARTGTIVRAAVLLIGGPGTDPDDYELVIAIGGTPVAQFPFVSGPYYTEFATAVASVPIAAAGVVSVRIRHADGGSRSPAWTTIEAYVDIESAGVLEGDVLPAAKYCGFRSIS